MWGNHMADATAAEEWNDAEWDVSREHITISVSQVLQEIASEPRWMWVDTHGTPITPSIPKDIKVRRLEKYLKDRDGYRAQRGAPAIWENTKVAFATRQYELKDSARGERARRVRVIWDKGWHGGNRAKGDCEEEDTKGVLCGEVDGQRHWIDENEWLGDKILVTTSKVYTSSNIFPEPPACRCLKSP